MKYIFLTISLFILALTGFSQAGFIANGEVIDDSTKQPLAGASVFCQNTTIGAVTNSEGKFRLQLPAGGYDLVISYTGYETQELRINNTNAADLRIELKAKDKSMSEVVIASSTSDPDGLRKYGKFFTNNFIGTTPYSDSCIIENPQALQFFFSKKKNRLKVKGKEELIISNKALGYKIKYQLDSFIYEYGTDISSYSGYPFFETLTGTPEEQERWKKNRMAAYKGSRLHFMRSWYDSTLKDEGFVLEWVDPSHKTITTFDVQNPYDSFHYKTDENSDITINWKDSRLKVAYRGELPEKTYLVQNKMPLYIRGQITVLDIKDTFVIEPNGFFSDQADVINTGYWSWKKTADALPYDYEPGL
ncbi:MAG: carboxypeptidase-like regulatory domain-containing protein [Chitinophagaceae bacterium]|nr:carboxypeptidase-like regulatory domain-containing protein [Chitinophagaceae bacterium]